MHVKKKIIFLLTMVILFSGLQLKAEETKVNNEQLNLAYEDVSKAISVEGKLDTSSRNEIFVNNLLSKNQQISYSDINDNQNNNEPLTPDHWAYQAVMELSKKYNILAGMPDGTFQGERPATRYELAQALAKLLQKVEKDHIELSPIEKAALDSVKNKLEKEILALAARVEKNEVRVADLEETHNADVDKLTSTLDEIKKRHHFGAELRFWGGLGDSDAEAIGRLRLNSKTYLSKNTFAKIRLEAKTANLVNQSERDSETTDADLTLGFIETGDLTTWIPKKLGTVHFIGGILPNNRLLTRKFTADVYSRGYSDSAVPVSYYNFSRKPFIHEGTNGRRFSVGGEYVKKFSKFNALIQAGALRSTGGSLARSGADIPGSGDESTTYSIMGKTDLGNLPIQLKVAHWQICGDNQGNKRTWSVGGRLSGKIDGFGVLKAAVIGHGGTTEPRLINGRGGHGMQYQFAFNPTIKAFGKLFGDPDKITHDADERGPAGKTEIGVAFANLHNRDDVDLRALDIYISRYINDRIWAALTYTHANPNSRLNGLSARNRFQILTNFKVK